MNDSFCKDWEARLYLALMVLIVKCYFIIKLFVAHLRVCGRDF